MKLLKLLCVLYVPFIFFSVGCETTVGTDNESSSINISNAVGGSSNPDTLTIAIGSSVTLYAAGYADNGGYVQDESASWSGAGSIGNYSASGSSNNFTATSAGVGYLVATSGSMVDSIKITVVPAAPTNLRSNSIENDAIKLEWDDAINGSNILGYNVYLSTSSSGAGATKASTSEKLFTFDNTKVSLKTKYYFFVSAYVVLSSGTYESNKSSIIDDAPTFVSKAIKISTRSGPNESALDLSGSVLYSLNAAVTGGPLADIWLDNNFKINGCANGEGDALGGLSSTWTRTTYIVDLGAHTLFADTVSMAPAFPSGATWLNQAPAVAGHVYALYTADNNYVKLRVDFVDTVGKEITVSISHQDIASYKNFKVAGN